METEEIKVLKEVGVVKESAGATPIEVVAEAQALEVAGGAGECGPTVDVGTGGITVRTPVSQVSGALIGTYEGVVDAASHVIERVTRAIKPQ